LNGYSDGYVHESHVYCELLAVKLRSARKQMIHFAYFRTQPPKM